MLQQAMAIAVLSGLMRLPTAIHHRSWPRTGRLGKQTKEQLPMSSSPRPKVVGIRMRPETQTLQHIFLHFHQVTSDLALKLGQPGC